MDTDGYDEWIPIEVVYLQPTATDGQPTITFDAFAAHLTGRTDPLSRLFADHLRRWQTAAGSIELPLHV